MVLESVDNNLPTAPERPKISGPTRTPPLGSGVNDENSPPTDPTRDYIASNLKSVSDPEAIIKEVGHGSLDNTLPITPERPKEIAKISGLKRTPPLDSGANDENSAPTDPTPDYITSKDLKSLSDPEAIIKQPGFYPDDDQFILDCLQDKVRGQQVHVNDIIEGGVHGKEEDIRASIGSTGVKLNFVKWRQKNQKGAKKDRLAEDGSWKRKKSNIPISNKRSDRPKGIKNTYVFVPASRHRKYERNLLMDEYELDKIPTDAEKWVICKIKLSPRKNQQSIDKSSVEKSPANTTSGPSHLPCETPIDHTSDPNIDPSLGDTDTEFETPFAGLAELCRIPDY